MNTVSALLACATTAAALAWWYRVNLRVASRRRRVDSSVRLIAIFLVFLILCLYPLPR